MGVYSFDVAFSSHALLQQGVTEAEWSRVVVAADSDADAHLLAAHFAHEMYPDLMVTAVLWRL